MKKTYLIFGIIIFAIILTAISLRVFTGEDAWLCVNDEWVKHGSPSAPKPFEGCGENYINTLPEISSFEDCVNAGYPILEIYPEQCKAPDGKTFTEDIGNELDKLDLIQVDYPRPNQIVFSPLEIHGKARGNWYFEASFPIKLIGLDGKIISSGIATSQSDPSYENGAGWMTEEFVPFTAKLEFSISTSTNAKIILEKDNPSGLSENADQLTIPVKLKLSTLANSNTTVKVFFNNNNLDPEISCNKVFSVDRNIVIEPNIRIDIYRTAIEELLKGPTTEDKNAGYYSNINSGVKIQSLTIENGVAKVDFDETLEKGVAGSCLISAIRAEITETLKQFSTIKDVIISVNGRTDDILQP
jgi:hypothetical protein